MKRIIIPALLLSILFFSACNKDTKPKDLPREWTCTILIIDLYNNPNVSTDTTKSATPLHNLTEAQAKQVCVAGSDTSFSPNGSFVTQTFLTPN